MILFSQYKHGNELLDTLYQAESPISLAVLMDKLHLSRRSIMYIMENVNRELVSRRLLPIGNIKGMGYFLSAAAKKALQGASLDVRREAALFLPMQWVLDSKALSPEEDRLLLNYIIITQDTTSINGLMDIFQASRNTILNRLRTLEAYNQGNAFHVAVTAKGRIAAGEERAQRKWVLENFERILALLGRFYLLSYDETVFQELQAYEQASGNRFTEDTRRSLKYFLTWYVYRLSRHRLLPAKSGNAGDTVWADRFLQARGVTSPAESAYLAGVLSLYAFSRMNSTNELYETMHQIAGAMTDQFFLISGLRPGIHHLMMVDSLAVHLVSLCHRVEAGMRYHNPLLEQIRTSYQNLFMISRVAAQPLTDYLGQRLSDDEVALLTTYFGSDIQYEQQGDEHRQILVVCSSGIGTSQFLLMQLRERYPHLQFTGPFRVSEYLHLSFQEIGLILTTTPLTRQPEEPVPILQISALPTDYEWELLNRKLLSAGFSVSAYHRGNVQALMDLIGNYARIEDESGLRQGLQAYFQDQQAKGKTDTVRSQEAAGLLKYVQLFPKEPMDWQTAVRLAFRPLQQHHFVHEAYVDKIIALTEEHGDYMLLGEGVLLAHAKPEDGVLSLSVAIAVCPEPVRLSSGKCAQCIICLAPVDQSSHLDFLAMLLEHINQPGWCKQLYQAGTQEELEDILQDFL
jgi:transcriptional antiterminator/mannitol/fructose-specific phosphotransferase system IIA component (Ntr-type)